jgi:hypothetical protein
MVVAPELPCLLRHTVLALPKSEPAVALRAMAGRPAKA